MWQCASIRPGITVLPVASNATCAPGGSGRADPSPAAISPMRSPSISSQCSGRGAAPVPSISRPLTMYCFMRSAPAETRRLVRADLAVDEVVQDRVELLRPLVVGRVRGTRQQREPAARHLRPHLAADVRRHGLVLLAPHQQYRE